MGSLDYLRLAAFSLTVTLLLLQGDSVSGTFFHYQPYNFNRHLESFRKQNYNFWHELYRSTFENRPFLRFHQANFVSPPETIIVPSDTILSHPPYEQNEIFSYPGSISPPQTPFPPPPPNRTTRPRTPLITKSPQSPPPSPLHYNHPQPNKAPEAISEAPEVPAEVQEITTQLAPKTSSESKITTSTNDSAPGIMDILQSKPFRINLGEPGLWTTARTEGEKTPQPDHEQLLANPNASRLGEGIIYATPEPEKATEAATEKPAVTTDVPETPITETRTEGINNFESFTQLSEEEATKLFGKIDFKQRFENQATTNGAPEGFTIFKLGMSTPLGSVTETTEVRKPTTTGPYPGFDFNEFTTRNGNFEFLQKEDDEAQDSKPHELTTSESQLTTVTTQTGNFAELSDELDLDFTVAADAMPTTEGLTNAPTTTDAVPSSFDLVDFILSDILNAALDFQRFVDALTDPLLLGLNQQVQSLQDLIMNSRDKQEVSLGDANQINRQVISITTHISLQRLRSTLLLEKKQRLENLAKLLVLTVESGTR